MEKKKKSSIIRSLSIIMVLIISVPIIVVCALFTQTFLSEQRNEMEEKVSNAMAEMQYNIGSSLDEVDAVLDELLFTQEFSYFLDRKNVLTEQEKNHYISSLERERINRKYVYKNKYDTMGIYSENQQIGEQGISWQFYMADLREKDYYSEIENSPDERLVGEIRSIDLNAHEANTAKLNLRAYGTPILPVYQKIRNINSGELVGVIELDIPVVRIVGQDQLLSEDINYIVLDDEKNVLLSTQNIEDAFFEELNTLLDGEPMMKTMGFGPNSYSVSYQIHDKTNLHLIAVASNRENFISIQEQLVKIVIVTLFCIIMMTVFIRKIINNVLRRLVVLDDRMQRVGHGDFNVMIQEDRKTEDEVTRITNSFNIMSQSIQLMIEERVEHEKNKKEAELRALQAQINPHFLYNTLDNMRMQCEADEYYQINDGLVALGSLFHYSIGWGSHEVPFELEWKNLKSYLSIMQMRFYENTEINLECEEGIEHIIVPKLILQPLVENSFNHGFKEKLPPWKLSVRAFKDENCLHIVVKDNGKGISKERMAELQISLDTNQPLKSVDLNKPSIGVTNVKQRIEEMCETKSSFTIQSENGQGTEIIIKIVAD